MTYPFGSENNPQPAAPPVPAQPAEATSYTPVPEQPVAPQAPAPPAQQQAPAPPTVFLPAQPMQPQPMQPMPAQPMPAQPMQPVSAPPTAYLPAMVEAPQVMGPATVVTDFGAPAGPSALRRNLVPVLAVVSGVLLLLSGVVIGLYVNERSELSKTRTTLQSQVQEQRDIVTQRDTKLAETEKRVGELTTELSVTETSLSSVTAERDVLLPCMRRVQELYDKLDARADLVAILTQTEDACNRAEETVSP
jgi:hypothetical protein